jgi:hypothetical protein
MAKRRIIIRELDFEKYSKSMIKNCQSVSFTPLTKNYFEKRATYFALKNKGYLADQYAHYEYPANMLNRLTGFKLYNYNYPSWLVRYTDSGNMVIRAGLRQPESNLGFVTLTERKKDERI